MPSSHRQIDSTINVVTPENISFRYRLAGPFRRFPAFLIDLSVRFSIWVGLLMVMAISGVMGSGGGALVISLWLVMWFVLEWFYGGLLETFWNGQTVGKRLLGMRVLQTDGQPINGLQAVMRNVLRFVDMMPFIPLGAGFGEEGPWIIPSCMIGLFAPVLWGRRYQRLGDLVCGTMVVVDQREWVATVARFEDPEVYRLAAELPGNFRTSHTLSQALAAYVERRRYLSAGRRREIAGHLGEPLTQRLRLPPETDPDRLLCALYLRTFAYTELPDAGSSAGAGLAGSTTSDADADAELEAVEAASREEVG